MSTVTLLHRLGGFCCEDLATLICSGTVINWDNVRTAEGFCMCRWSVGSRVRGQGRVSPAEQRCQTHQEGDAEHQHQQNRVAHSFNQRVLFWSHGAVQTHVCFHHTCTYPPARDSHTHLPTPARARTHTHVFNFIVLNYGDTENVIPVIPMSLYTFVSS